MHNPLMANPASHPVPDPHGANPCTIGPQLRRLPPARLAPDLLAHLLPHLEQLGALAEGVRDTLAHRAATVAQEDNDRSAWVLVIYTGMMGHRSAERGDT